LNHSQKFSACQMRADYKVKKNSKEGHVFCCRRKAQLLKALSILAIARWCGRQSKLRRQQKSMVCFTCNYSWYPLLSGTDPGRFPGFLFASLLLGMFLIESHPVFSGNREHRQIQEFQSSLSISEKTLQGTVSRSNVVGNLPMMKLFRHNFILLKLLKYSGWLVAGCYYETPDLNPSVVYSYAI
jgi:hypothetical protein